MRYAETHKQETRERVLKVAAKALREKGPEGMGVAEVMREAGLTHGGFYAHFPSKDAFLVDALNEIIAQGAERMRELTEGLGPREALAVYVDFYVSAGHRDRRDAGCPLVALNSDLPRQSANFRAAFDAGVKRLVARLAQWMSDGGLKNPEALAVATLSAMMGAVALSRAVSDPDLSDSLLEAARAGIMARLGLDEFSISASEQR